VFRALVTERVETILGTTSVLIAMKKLMLQLWKLDVSPIYFTLVLKDTLLDDVYLAGHYINTEGKGRIQKHSNF
jgi:hypothetical protein